MSSLSTAANPSPFDPLDRMPPDEGRFVIREKDPAGPPSMTAWAHARRNWAIRRYGIEPTGDAKRLLDAEMLQCRQAEDLALDWQEKLSGGEEVEAQKATYNEVRQTEEQLTAAKRQKVRTDLLRHLSEADALAHELIEIDGPAATAAQAEKTAALHEIALGFAFGEKARAA